MTTIRLPRLLWDDDQTPEAGLLKVQRESARFIWVDSQDPALGELYSYADYYAGVDVPGGLDEGYKHLGKAAKRLLPILEKAGWNKARATAALAALKVD